MGKTFSHGRRGFLRDFGGVAAVTAVPRVLSAVPSGSPPSDDATIFGIQYIASQGSDSNDGLSWSTAKATISGALTALGSTPGRIYFGPGDFGLGAVTLSEPHFIYLGAGTYSFTSLVFYAPATIQGMGDSSVLYCSSTAGHAITFTPYSPSTPGNGLRDLIVKGAGATNSTVGLYFGATGGAGVGSFSEFHNIDITLFGVGAMFDSTSWGFCCFRGCSFYNNNGNIYAAPNQATERVAFIDCEINSPATWGGAQATGSIWMDITPGTTWQFIGGSIDFGQVITGSKHSVKFIGTYFEDNYEISGGGSHIFVSGTADTCVSFTDCQWFYSTNGTSVPFVGANGGNVQVSGGKFWSNGTTAAEAFTMSGGTLAVGLQPVLVGYPVLYSLSSAALMVPLDIGPTASTASSGGATLPLYPVGFVVVNIGGSNYKIPYYNI